MALVEQPAGTAAHAYEYAGAPFPAPAPNPTPAPRRLAHTAPAAPPVVQLSVVVVNFCQWKNTARLVRQLRRSAAMRMGEAEVRVVDNASPSHTLATRLAKIRGVTVRQFDTNLGFATAVNRGARAGSGEWVLLLNPDITVPDGFLDDVLGTTARADLPADAGVIGFRLLNRDGTPQPSAGAYPTFVRTLAGLFVSRARRKCDAPPGDAKRAVEWATGGCLLVRRACFEALGGLDESFFLYYEDVDFCRRAAAAGWGVWFDPSVQVTHHWPLHTRPVPAPLRLVTRHALLKYAQRYWRGWQAKVLGGIVWTEATARLMWAALRRRATDASCYAHLRRLVGDVRAQRDDVAAERIRYAAGFLSPIAAEQDGRTQ
jgi:N-acetylglucosaminyl-diphospho-decaprenol L-rhamnosyltransferase